MVGWGWGSWWGMRGWFGGVWIFFVDLGLIDKVVVVGGVV